jgi:hypothetical protein
VAAAKPAIDRVLVETPLVVEVCVARLLPRRAPPRAEVGDIAEAHWLRKRVHNPDPGLDPRGLTALLQLQRDIRVISNREKLLVERTDRLHHCRTGKRTVKLDILCRRAPEVLENIDRCAAVRVRRDETLATFVHLEMAVAPSPMHDRALGRLLEHDR